MRDKSLLIIVTHPTQYMVPWFRYLASHEKVKLKVWYVTIPDSQQQGVGFNQAFSWDVPLLDGYLWDKIGNSAKNPGLDRFFGTRIQNPLKHLRDFSPDTVLITGWHQYSLVQFTLACNRLKIPCLIRGDSNNLKSRSWIKSQLHRKLLSRFQRYLYVGQANRGFYLDNGALNEQLYFTPHFVDNDWFRQYLPDKPRLRREWRSLMGIGDQDFVVTFVGKLQAKKNVVELISSFTALTEKIPNCCLVIVGDGELSSELQSFAQQTNSKITFTGFVNQTGLPSIYLSSDCLVLTSDFGETWGLVVNEAMNCGLPVVVSDRVGCGLDLIIEGKTGFSYPYGNQYKLTEKLEILGHNPNLREEMGAQAGNKIKNYSFQRATQGLMQALESLD